MPRKLRRKREGKRRDIEDAFESEPVFQLASHFATSVYAAGRPRQKHLKSLEQGDWIEIEAVTSDQWPVSILHQNND